MARRTGWHRPPAWLLAGVLGLAFVVIGCRRQAVWAGAAFFPEDGGQLRLAAEQPDCGCLTILNRSGRTLLLRATLRGAPVGGAEVAAGAQLVFRFDWAGPRDNDYYLLEGIEDGQHVDLRQALQLGESPRWQPCETIACPYGSLQMNVAETGR
ncbi:MAG: hypothetical protein KGN76_09815 [Acidobacteriota bacterium]|nr:hypothetical protein [Acidobacteriota bacterium]